ncbi:HlyD family efflux transporter periplasmic adaptor subunit [Legionella micdadei]|uniref:Membrane fusion protein, multidrug efflux system n=1 Tax=Legionella micdadei TaxID=451 RepID=A0A098GH60_LEGMI|nr:HlyD family efflux transporter periplasmic adaptor subunit [Legionella micdadei]ARG97225.1 EmrA/EmrK family multidrug efflux transporter periplasmic adaptor subunit [Legionella micdadei]ARH00518.1 EmrA/EmrK family multidrug efflux transporter periplasmic adaptor subunit [Legionella micdadei]KTD29168.1 multidrug efflux system [Legionella micdadei]CEG61322.1 Multidrug resistance protein A [Legionella micdadei]SCY37637.1 membrane fusion protein, multidrug efflux system [Legionella micdadei]
MPTVDQLPITPEEKLGKKRKFLLVFFTTFLVVVAMLYGLYWWFIARFYEETDNAYVNGNIIPITAQVGGTVVAVKVDDTQYVTTGQLLVELDPIDAFIAFEQAKANLAQTLRNTHQLFINNTGLQANLKNQEISQEKAKQDLSRRNRAIGVGAVSKEELTHAEDSLKSANAALTQAKSALLANRALTENTNLQQHPNVLAAAAKLRQAYVDYMRTTIRAPVSGEISKRTAQVGQRVAAGTQLMALVPLEQVWVEANFKEKQVRYMRIGQPATLTADLYGSSVVYHGTIVGFSAGTGSAFALLPAQNATGNWIKVVQRLPVRIKLDPKELKAHPLRIGLSMEVTVDLHNQSGKYISETAPISIYETPIYENWGKEADAEINKVISENISKTANLDASDNSNRDSANKGISR